MTGLEILALPMQENDSGTETVKGYLVALLHELWDKEDGFSGKRPFGNSGWPLDLVQPLIRAGLVVGTFDEEGYLEEFDDWTTANRLIKEAINAL